MAKSIKKDLRKLNKVIHPNSRKAQKLNEKSCRIEAREKSKKLHLMRENLVGERLIWFQEHLVPNVKVYTKEMFSEVIEQYLGRFDEEMKNIHALHSIGHRQRRYASREDILNMTINHDKEEFETCGLEVPDLLNSKQLEYLRLWNRELRFLQNFKLKRYTRSQLAPRNKAKALSKDEKEDSTREGDSLSMTIDEAAEDTMKLKIKVNDDTTDNVKPSSEDKVIPSSSSVEEKKECANQDLTMNVDDK